MPIANVWQASGTVWKAETSEIIAAARLIDAAHEVRTEKQSAQPRHRTATADHQDCVVVGAVSEAPEETFGVAWKDAPRG